MNRERDVVRALQESASVRAIERALGGLSRVAACSRAASAMAGVGRALRLQEGGWRFQLALIALVAAAVHVLLMVANGGEPGWMWLLVPATVGIAGLLVMVTDRHDRQEHRYRA